jgi:hypothetical protein
LFQTCVGTNLDSWLGFGHEPARLPINVKGCGQQELLDPRPAQSLGGLVQSVMPLLDQKDTDQNTIVRRLNISAVVNLLGEDLFDQPFDAPWERHYSLPTDLLAILLLACDKSKAI